MQRFLSSLMLILLVAFSSTARAGEAALPMTSALPPLKAVLVVGPIDGDNGSWTTREKANMELAAAELEANNVTVTRFYTPNNNWEAIKAAAQGAHFFFYRGHGVYWSAMPSPKVGGFSLQGDMISSEDVRDLQLAPNAIVMLYGCFTAGTAGNDKVSISSQEAQRRVAEYSDPLMDIGVAGYYANWFGDAFQFYVRNLFAGKTLGESYEAYFDFNADTVERYSHPQHDDASMWLDKDNWQNQIKYNNAFVGQANQTLSSLFQTQEPAMQLSQTDLSLWLEPGSGVNQRAVTISAVGGASFHWTATSLSPEAGWLTLSALSGGCDQQIRFHIDPSGLAPGAYHADVQIQADATTLGDSRQTLHFALHVVENLEYVYLPLVRS